MAIRNFDDLRKKAAEGEKRTVAVAAAHDEHALKAVLAAEEQKLIDYLLVGNKEEILRIGNKLGFYVPNERIIDITEDDRAAAEAVALINGGEADFLMKGKLLTATIMKAVLNKEHGLQTGRMMSHVALIDIQSYHKLLGATDGGIIPYPDLDAKKQIAINAVELFHSLGYDKPKLGAVCAVEVLNPKLRENVEAAKLKQMAIDGEIPGCVIEGPISMDLATDMASVKAKEYESEIAGDVDILLMHEMATCNIMIKSITYLGGGKMAGIVMGAKCPIVVPSRGSSFDDKFDSLLLSKLVMNGSAR